MNFIPSHPSSLRGFQIGVYNNPGKGQTFEFKSNPMPLFWLNMPIQPKSTVHPAASL